MPLPELTGEINLKDNSSVGFNSAIANAERANRAWSLTSDQIQRLQEHLQQFGLAFDTATSRFKNLDSGGMLTFNEALKQLPEAARSGVGEFDTLVGKLRLLTQTERDAETESLRLQQNLNALGNPNSAGLDRMRTQFQQMRTQIDELQQRSSALNQGGGFGNASGPAENFKNMAQAEEEATDQAYKLVDGIEKVSTVMSQGNDLKRTPEQLRTEFASVEKQIGQLSGRLKSIGAELKQSFGEEVGEEVGNEFGKKIGAGIKNFVALTPGGLIPGSDRALLALGSAFESLSPSILLAAGSFGVFAAAAAGAVFLVRQTESALRELEVRDILKQKLAVTFDTTNVDQTINTLKTDLGNRLTKEEVFKLAVTIDKTSILADAAELVAMLKVVQGYATATGTEFQGMSLQIIAAINKGDGALLEQQGFIDSAKGALVKYAAEHGTTVDALTATQKQQALVNAVMEKMGPIAAGATKPVDNLAAAQEELKTAVSEGATAFGNWIASFLDPKANSFAEALATRIHNLATNIDYLNQLMSGKTQDQIIKVRLGDEEGRNFDNVKAELEKIRQEERQISAAGDDASEADRAKLQKMLNDLEERRKLLQAGLDRAIQQFQNGQDITPLPKAFNPLDWNKQSADNIKKTNTEYADSITQANAKLEESTKRVATAQEFLNRVKNDQNKDVKQSTDATAGEIALRQSQLVAVNQQIADAQAKLNNPPRLAQPERIDLTQQLNDLKTQRNEIIDEITGFQNDLDKLNQLAASGQAVQGFDQQLKAIQSSGVSNVTELEKQNAEIARLTQDRSIAFTKFQIDVQKAVGQGLNLPTSGSLEEIMKAIGDETSRNSASLQIYNGELDIARGKVQEVADKLQNLPQPKIDTSAVAAIQQQLNSAVSVRDQLNQEVANLQKQMADQGKTAAENSALSIKQGQAELADAQSKRAAASALVDLLNAEKAYLLAHEEVRYSQKTGDLELILHNEKVEESAKATLEQAQNQIKATSGAQAYADSLKRVSEALGQTSAASTQQTGALDTVWDDAITKLQNKAEKNPVKLPVVLDAPKTENGVPAPQGAGTDSAGNVKEIAKAADDAAGAEKRYTDVLNLNILASHAVNEAYRGLLAARVAGNAVTIAAAQAEYDKARANQDSTKSAATAALADLNKAKADVQAAIAAQQHGRAVQSNLSVLQEFNGSANRAADATLRLGQAGSQAVDGVSRLPVAFHSAGLASEQFKAQIRDLEAELQSLQAAATNAAFSIAQSLVPSLGIAGSLQQGSAWAEQAAAVKDTFETLNEGRVAAGQDPLGAQVLDTSLNALKANWSAYAQDATASMDKVGGAADKHAQKLEKMASQIDKALDGMVKGVLQDSTKGLIEGAIKDPKELEKLLPREDTIDEKARRMADIAVKGFKSPWYASLKDLFPEDVLKGGEGAIRKAAAEMVRAHQEGLSTMLYDADAAAQKVIEQLQGKQNMDAFVAQVREKVKALGKDVKDLDIKKALGIDVEEEMASGGGGGGRTPALSKVLSFDQIIAQMKDLAKNESPLVGLMEPKDAGKEKIKAAGKDTASTAGDALTNQATEGKYGEKAINGIVTQLKSKEADVKQSGQQVADWLGGALLERFGATVPAGLLDILVDHLVDRIESATAKKEERTSGSGGTTGAQ